MQASAAPSGRNDGVLVATEQRTGFVAMEAAACQDGVLCRMVRVLVNCGDTAFEEFGNDALRDASDLAALASTHSSVRVLIEEKKQLSAALRGVRLLLRDPSARLLQRVGRGMIGRRRAKSRLAAVEDPGPGAPPGEVQVCGGRHDPGARANLRAALCYSSAQSSSSALSRQAPGVRAPRPHGPQSLPSQAAICQQKREIHRHRRCVAPLPRARRRYLGNYSRGRVLAKKLAKLLEKELLAANERELKNAVHATLCANTPTEVTVVEGRESFMKKLCPSLYRHLKNLDCNADISNLQPAVAQLITKDLKVEVHGKHIKLD